MDFPPAVLLDRNDNEACPTKNTHKNDLLTISQSVFLDLDDFFPSSDHHYLIIIISLIISSEIA